MTELRSVALDSNFQRPIERGSPMPMWAQVLRDLRHRIDSGELPTGTRLPTENDLASSYAVSRITIRQSLSRLAADGYVDRLHGTGTFVSERAAPVQHDLSFGTPWRVRLGQDGHVTESVILNSSVRRGLPPEIDASLGAEIDRALREGEFVQLERVQKVDGQPVGLSQSWLPEQLVRGLHRCELDGGSLSETLAQRYGLSAARVDNRLHVGLATSTEAALLEAYVDVPLFVVTALTTMADGQLLEVSRTAWLGSRVRFRSVVDA